MSKFSIHYIRACSYIQEEYLLEGIAVLRWMKPWGICNCY